MAPRQVGNQSKSSLKLIQFKVLFYSKKSMVRRCDAVIISTLCHSTQCVMISHNVIKMFVR